MSIDVEVLLGTVYGPPWVCTNCDRVTQLDRHGACSRCGSSSVTRGPSTFPGAKAVTVDALVKLKELLEQDRIAQREDVTDTGKAVWGALWSNPWPDGWRVEWRPEYDAPFFQNPLNVLRHGITFGFCDRTARVVMLNREAHDRRRWVGITPVGLFPSAVRVEADATTACPLNTLVHELLHVRGLNHSSLAASRAYDRIVRHYVGRLWQAAMKGDVP